MSLSESESESLDSRLSTLKKKTLFWNTCTLFRMTSLDTIIFLLHSAELEISLRPQISSLAEAFLDHLGGVISNIEILEAQDLLDCGLATKPIPARGVLARLKQHLQTLDRTPLPEVEKIPTATDSAPHSVLSAPQPIAVFTDPSSLHTDPSGPPPSPLEPSSSLQRDIQKIHIKGFITWCNFVLGNSANPVTSIADFRTGILLATILQRLFHEPVPLINPKPRSKIHCIENLYLCLTHASDRHGCVFHNISAEDLYHASDDPSKTNLLLGCLFQLICKSKMSLPPALPVSHQPDSSSPAGQPIDENVSQSYFATFAVIEIPQCTTSSTAVDSPGPTIQLDPAIDTSIIVSGSNPLSIAALTPPIDINSDSSSETPSPPVSPRPDPLNHDQGTSLEPLFVGSDPIF